MTVDKIFEIVDKLMGPCGRMLSGSKSGYLTNHQKNLVVFNGNLFTKLEKGKYQKIWFGDVDVTRQKPMLIKLAKQLGTTVYLLREMDGRFDNETNPKIEKAVIEITAD